MTVLELSGSGLLSGNVLELALGFRSFDVEWNADRTQFRVKVGEVYYGWFVYSTSNKKAVLVFLREMYDS